MRLLPKPRREAMFAIYAFCREVDDIADGDDAAADKTRALDDWRAEIERLYQGMPGTPIGQALMSSVRDHGLEKQAFLAVIDGMQMDADADIRGPDWDRLSLYCARVAGAVGQLSVRAFGAAGDDAQALARALGEALQLTNILRDLSEDAARGRLYLPAEELARAGIDSRDPAVALAHPEIGRVCDAVAQRAGDRFDQARILIRRCPRRAMRPARAMMEVYRRVLIRLRRRGWRRLDENVSLSRPYKLLIALRYGLF